VGIPTVVHYPLPLNRQPAVADLNAKLPIGDKAANEVLSLPMHGYMTEAFWQVLENGLPQAFPLGR
jgi:UDP-2-acetamido-2-deoxy-ribo-hexuluronate aminotransferase